MAADGACARSYHYETSFHNMDNQDVVACSRLRQRRLRDFRVTRSDSFVSLSEVTMGAVVGIQDRRCLVKVVFRANCRQVFSRRLP